MIYRRALKRLIDILSSIVLLILCSPIIFISAILIQLSSPGGVFFKQVRIGKNEESFELLKFRTMYKNPSRVLSQTRMGDADITPVGAIMRRLKIDELPQLINVLVGEMSLVGPRPCLPDTAKEAPSWARKRFEARPGLTGLAQVNGNISLSWEQRWIHDVAYVDAISWHMDCKIFFKTILVVLLGEERFRRV
jgi:undecaprenyl phosphate N,N'-diacetylbacillosamine 1-phosphate transferase